MDENKFEGAARDLGGKAQEFGGKLTGDNKMRADGAMNQAAGTAQKAYGQVKDVVRDVGGEYGSQLLDQIEDAGDALADQIDQRPITAILIAAGIGFLLALATKPAPKVIYRRR
ncbi:MAG: CsbD family protein [Pseudomonadota bacterium]|nr:CsbD family protein [Pseudomonadota bacterium]